MQNSCFHRCYKKLTYTLDQKIKSNMEDKSAFFLMTSRGRLLQLQKDFCRENNPQVPSTLTLINTFLIGLHSQLLVSGYTEQSLMNITLIFYNMVIKRVGKEDYTGYQLGYQVWLKCSAQGLSPTTDPSLCKNMINITDS